MFSDDMIVYAVFGFGVLAAGTIIYVILDSILASTDKAEKRKKLVAGGAQAKLESREGMVEQRRRKQVQDAIDELEEKKKKKKKLKRVKKKTTTKKKIVKKKPVKKKVVKKGS